MGQHATVQQWQAFIQKQPVDDTPAPFVLESWQRCRAAGVTGDTDAPAFRRVPEHEIEQRLASHRSLLTIAEPHLQWLSASLSQTPHAAYMTDRDGIVLRAYGDRGLIDAFGLSPGYDWSEQQMGTNGAGAALAEGQPVAVVGADHYCKDFHDRTGTGAPVHAPDGTLLGAIDLSTRVADGTPDRLGLVSHIAFCIECELARRAAEQNQHHLAAIVESSEDAVISGTLEGIVTSWNRGAERLYGYTAEEMIGHSAAILMGESSVEQLLTIRERMLRGERIEPFETRRIRKDGTMVDVSVRISPIRDDNGEVTGALGVARDISERKQLEISLRESQTWFEQLFESLAVGVYATDSKGRIQRYNEAMARIWGRRPALDEDSEWFCGSWCIYRLDGTPLPHADCPMARAVLTGEAQHDEIMIERPDGSRLIAAVHPSPIRDSEGRMIGAINCIIDITDHKAAEDAAAREHAESRRRAEQLQRLTAELTQAEQRERHRLAQVLHDHLQQLLVGVKFTVNNLQNSAADESTGTGLQYIDELIDESIETSRSLTRELSPPLLYDAGLAPALQWLARWVQERQGLTVNLDLEDSIKLDEAARVLLFESVRELLLNVVKHAGTSEAWVTLALDHEAEQKTDQEKDANGHAQPDYKMVRITVTDRGLGFDPTARAATQAGSFGLFSLTERLNWLGGCMTVDAAPSQGTRVTLSMPYRQPTAAPAASAETNGTRAITVTPSDDATGERRRVMLVDDHHVMRDGLRQLLESAGDLEVVGEAGNGHDAVAQAHELHPDLVIMDVTLPGLNGIDATRRICDELPGTRIIGLSMHEDREIAAAILKAGAEAYFNKTEASEQLLAAIRTPTQVIDSA